MNRQPFQFSLRSLFWLTAVVAVVLGTMTALGRTHSFRALGSIQAYSALVPIAAVWLAWRVGFLVARRLVITSLLFFVTSMVLPSSSGPSRRPMPGYAAVLLSFVGSTMHPFQSPPDDATVVPWPFYFEFDVRDWLGCCMGLIANVAYLLILLSMILRRFSKRLREYLSWSAFLSAMLLLIPLGFSMRLDNIYIGYGVWVAAMLAMWLRVREDVTYVSTFAHQTGISEAGQPAIRESLDALD